MTLAIQFEDVSKQYRLGEIGSRTLARDLRRMWSKLRGRPDPYVSLGQVNDREVAGGEFVWALKDINLGVAKGEVFGIIGPNGAGKSTLLKLLSSVTAPTTGRIRAQGRIASLLEVGTGFHPELTGRENVYLNGAILGMTRRQIRRRLDEIVDFSGCARYIDTPVKRYSSGMTVRLGFAVAAHLECEILVVDEVLAVGDASFQKKCIGRMSEVAECGKTVLFVSHSMQSVEQLCTQACVLEQGQVSSIGSVSDAITEYFRSFSTRSRTGGADSAARKGTGAATISCIRVQNQQGEEATVFEKGEKARLAFTVQVDQTIERLGVTISIASGMTRQEATSIERVVINDRVVAGSTVEFSVDFDTSLMRPGIYPLQYSLNNGFDQDLSYDVVEDGTRPLSIVGDGTGRIKGVFDLPSRVLEQSVIALKHPS